MLRPSTPVSGHRAPDSAAERSDDLDGYDESDDDNGIERSDDFSTVGDRLLRRAVERRYSIEAACKADAVDS